MQRLKKCVSERRCRYRTDLLFSFAKKKKKKKRKFNNIQILKKTTGRGGLLEKQFDIFEHNDLIYKIIFLNEQKQVSKLCGRTSLTSPRQKSSEDRKRARGARHKVLKTILAFSTPSIRFLVASSKISYHLCSIFNTTRMRSAPTVRR